MDDVAKYGWLGAVGVILIKEIVSWFKGSTREHIKAIEANTIAVVELKVHLKYLSERIDQLPEMRSDLDAAHSAIRQIKKDMSQ